MADREVAHGTGPSCTHASEGEPGRTRSVMVDEHLSLVGIEVGTMSVNLVSITILSASLLPPCPCPMLYCGRGQVITSALLGNFRFSCASTHVIGSDIQPSLPKRLFHMLRPGQIERGRCTVPKRQTMTT